MDLILGGHDHIIEIDRVNDTYIIKSGTDFRNLGHLELTFPSAEEKEEIKKGAHSKWKPEDLLHDKFVLKVEVLDVSTKYEPNPELKEHVEEYLKDFAKKMEKVNLFTREREISNNMKIRISPT